MKRFVSILAALAMLLTLAVCGGGSAEQSSGSDVDKLVSDYGFQWEDTSAPILNEKGARELSYTVYSSKNASALDYNDMKVMQDLFASTNVKVNWENVSESIYAQQKNLIFGNTDDRPDAIYHAGMSAGEIIKYAQRHVLLPINEYLQYMPNLSKILEERPDIKSQLTSEDGNIYSLPHVEEMGLLQNPNLLFLNKNWAAEAIRAGAVDGLDEADLADGLTLTCEQMEKLLTYFKDNDMNGNGQTDDERPMSFVYNNWLGNQCDLYGMFGLNDNTDHRVIVDGKVIYTVQDERFKEATNFIADWVSRDLIDKVSFELSQDNFLANGKSEETYGAFYWWESETVVSHSENYIVCAPLIGPNGDQTVCVSNNPEISTGEVIIFADCQNPEVLCAYFDRYYDPITSAQINYGPIGIVYEEEPDENGMLVQKELTGDMTADELRLQNAPLGIFYLSDYAWNNVVHMEPRAQLRLERLALCATPYVADGVKPCPTNLQFTLDELNVLSSYESNLNDYIRTNLIKWLMGGGVSDADWETFTNDLNGRTNLEKIQQTYQDVYDRYISSADQEDGDLTGKITVTSLPELNFTNGKATPENPGDYELTYSVQDKGGLTAEAYATLTVGRQTGEEEVFLDVDFSAPVTADDHGWQAVVADGVQASGELKQGAYVFDITDPGQGDGDIQLVKSGVALKAADYKVKVWAKSTKDTYAHLLAVDEDAEEWTTFGGAYNLPIGAEIAPLELDFTAPGEGSAALTLNLGKITPNPDNPDDTTPGDFTVTIDKIEIYEITGEQNKVPAYTAAFTAADQAAVTAGDGASATATVADGAAVFQIDSYPAEGGVWSVKADLAMPGVSVEAGQKYYYSFTVTAENDQSGECLVESAAEADAARANFNGLSLTAGEETVVTNVFTAEAAVSDPVIRLQIGNPADGVSSNTLTVSALEFGTVEGDQQTAKTIDAFGQSIAGDPNPDALWTTYNGTDEDNERGVGTVWTEDGSLFYRIDQGGSVDWHNKLILGHSANKLTLPADSYFTVEITAKATKPVSCGFFLNPMGGWDPRVSQTLDLTEQEQTFSFDTTDTLILDMDFEMLFQFGSDATAQLGEVTVQISDITITQRSII